MSIFVLKTIDWQRLGNGCILSFGSSWRSSGQAGWMDTICTYDNEYITEREKDTQDLVFSTSSKAVDVDISLHIII